MSHCYKCLSTENLRAKSKFSYICKVCSNEEAAKYRKSKIYGVPPMKEDELKEWKAKAEASYALIMERRT